MKAVEEHGREKNVERESEGHAQKLPKGMPEHGTPGRCREENWQSMR